MVDNFAARFPARILFSTFQRWSVLAGKVVSLEGVVCDHLTKIYGGSGGAKALDDLSFSLPSNGIFALIGRNGSGKTTLVRILATELEPTSGQAFINGIDVVREPRKLRQKIAIVPQEARPVPWMTPMQTTQSYLLWRGFRYSESKEKAFRTLQRLGLGEYCNDLNRKLSGGMRRKVMVATVLATEAEVIFLDEPTTGLDPISRREFWETLREVGKERFTFLTTHYLEEAEELGNRIGILDRGRLARIGTMNELRESVSHNYSLRVLSGNRDHVPEPKEGETIVGTDGSLTILTTEEEAYRMSRELSKQGLKFAVNPISLDDIFLYLVGRRAIE
jgi:ABC-2 type transport system ATP-binding protein